MGSNESIYFPKRHKLRQKTAKLVLKKQEGSQQGNTFQSQQYKCTKECQICSEFIIKTPERRQ